MTSDFRHTAYTRTAPPEPTVRAGAATPVLAALGVHVAILVLVLGVHTAAAALPVSGAPSADGPTVAEVPAVPDPVGFGEEFAGTWSGTVSQSPAGGPVRMTYDVVIEIQAGRGAAPVSYPTLGCSGEHRLRSVSSATEVDVEEVITGGEGNCFPSVPVSLSLADDGLRYFFESHGEVGTATLSRSAS